MVDQQELKHTVLCLFGDLSLCLDLHVVAYGNHAAWLQAGSSPCIDLYQTHPAHPHRIHSGVMAEPGNVGAVALTSVNKQFIGACLDFLAVDDDTDRRHLTCCVRGLSISHWNTSARTGIELRLVILASYSWRKRRIVETIGATDEGPSGQIVVCFGGKGTASRPSSGWAATG